MTNHRSEQKSRDKWNRIYNKATTDLPSPATVLADHQYLLPTTGNALDIACGLGGNALLLATIGLTTTAIDISEEGIKRLRGHAESNGLDISALTTAASADYFRNQKEFQSNFDVITVTNYLDRELFDVIPDLLAPKGLLFYQTFVREKTVSEAGPSNPEFLLGTNELLALNRKLTCRVYYDLGATGKTDCGLRNQSAIVAQKEGV